MDTDTDQVPAGRRSRRRRVVLVLVVVLALLVGSAVLLLVPWGDQAPRQAGSALGSSAGLRVVGDVSDPQGGRVRVDPLIVTGDRRARAIVRRGPEATAEVTVVEGRSYVKATRSWWDGVAPGRAAALAGKRTEVPKGTRGLPPLDRLTPAMLQRELASPGTGTWSKVGEREIAGERVDVSSDGDREVYTSPGDPSRVLGADISIAPDGMTLPGGGNPTGGAPGTGSGPWKQRANVTIDQATDSEIKSVPRTVEELRREGPLGDAGPVNVDGGVDTANTGGAETGDVEAGDALPVARTGVSVDAEQAREAVSKGLLPPLPVAGPGLETPPAARRPASGPEREGDPGGRTRAAQAETGGIDLSAVDLRYIGDVATPDGPRLSYAFSGPPVRAGRGETGDVNAVRQASDAFFVWLALPTDKAWVNLNPAEPDRVIDPLLARTDAGRVLLEADLAMKKIGEATKDPRTPLGARYWAALRAEGAEDMCGQSRFWIVPGPAVVHEQGDGLHILDAPLQVRVESEIPLSEPGAECPPTTEQMREHHETVERQLVAPRIARAVNEDPRFAELRRVYLSRVAAQWYRQRSAERGTGLGGLVDGQDVTPWVSPTPWTPRAVFDRYVDAYRNPAIDVVVGRETRGNQIFERRISVGGVDWADVPLLEVDPATAERRHPGREQAVAGSFDRPVVDPDGMVWVGSSHELPDAWAAPDRSVATWTIVAAIGVGALALWVYRQRRPPSAGPQVDDDTSRVER